MYSILWINPTGKRIEEKSDDSAQRMRATSHFQALMARSDRQGVSCHTEIDSSDQGSEFSENDPTPHDAENLDVLGTANAAAAP